MCFATTSHQELTKIKVSRFSKRDDSDISWIVDDLNEKPKK
ncbi:hypothetical protein [Williamsoniiplasma luminosum]|nr:hypothetical protein [Williamsoniiplasma luminosum]